MAIDQWGRVIPDYSWQNYIDELLRQKEAIEHRLADVDKRYAPQPSPQIPINSTNAPVESKQMGQPYILVNSEKEARDYPIIKNINDDVGKVHFFVLPDESTIFAKSINPSTWELEFYVYKRETTDRELSNSVNSFNTDVWANIDSRLQKIESFIDIASSVLLNGGLSQSPADTPTVDTKKSKTGNQISKHDVPKED